MFKLVGEGYDINGVTPSSFNCSDSLQLPDQPEMVFTV